MLRSIIAIIAAVVAGLFAARFFEIVGSAALSHGGPASGAITVAHQAMLVIGWAFAAFIASAIALLIGRRWAPLGWLGAATIFLLALISLAGQTTGLLIWIGAGAGTAAGGWAGVRLLKGDYTHPARRDPSAH